MISIVTISLENEMDLVLAHRRSMMVGMKLNLTTATQTTFATAVSEIAREVIEHTDKGFLDIGLAQHKERYSLAARLTYDADIDPKDSNSGFFYAQKLVPEFEIIPGQESTVVEMKIGLPRSLRLDPIKVNLLVKYFEEEPPINAYEQIKVRNKTLNRIADQREEELRRSRIIDQQKSEFISIASHEIKTPITIIKAYTQIANRMKDLCDVKVSDLLDKIDVQSTKLLLLVQQLLDVAKAENGSLQYSMEEVDFNEFVEHMMDILKHILADNEIRVTYAEPVKVNLDKLRMEQVFSNLLSNAAKYSGKNSRIDVECTVEEEQVKVAVRDKGIGMSKKTVGSVFDKFYRDQEVLKTHAGLGMGLYITSKIISDHAGKIWVESVEGEGSTFYFVLPRVN